MDVMTTTAPMSAKTPGFSPLKRNTHTGFRSGSIAPSRQQASGGQYRLAFTYST